MGVLKNRKILLAVSGSIAAYKSTYLVREFIKRGAEVQVVMTHSAKSFVTPLVLGTLSKRPVYSEFVEPENESFGLWNNHVDMGLWADLMIVAPASSNTLSKLASGACDNLLSAVYMSAKCPVFIAPAMDLDMYENGATKSNLEILASRGVNIIEAGHGELASGLVGKGRMAEPEEIRAIVESHLESQLPLRGKNILINAGPTHEHIDPVRYIGNNSTGKMGVSIARAAVEMGANVRLVLGPTQADLDLEGMEVVRVTSADEMLGAMQHNFESSVLTICTAAVSDFKPKGVANHKLKKKDAGMNVEMVQTPDILATLGAKKADHQFVVGFALETQNGEAYALDKLKRKNANAIVLNINSPQTGFESSTNAVSVYFKDSERVEYELMEKEKLGRELMLLWTKMFGLDV